MDFHDYDTCISNDAYMRKMNKDYATHISDFRRTIQTKEATDCDEEQRQPHTEIR